MTPAALRQSTLFAELRATAARIGADPKQVQGPGGNVSLKSGDVMLVKASGTWMADAEKDDVFSAVDCAAMKSAVEQGAAAADNPKAFQLGDGLKPSIETGFHAIFDAPVVIHTHCVATLARSTAPIPQPQLDQLGLIYVPYLKPGATLASAILSAWKPGARGVVLGNHGIIALGQSPDEAEAVLTQAATAFDTGNVPIAEPDPSLAAELEGSDWEALGPGPTTALAFDKTAIATASGLALFPDQVIFLGPSPFVSSLPVIHPDGPPQSLALIPERGAAIPRSASPALRAIAEMMGEVVFRLPKEPTRLSQVAIGELLGWDAEKHRQALELARTKRLSKGSAP